MPQVHVDAMSAASGRAASEPGRQAQVAVTKAMQYMPAVHGVQDQVAAIDSATSALQEAKQLYQCMPSNFHPWALAIVEWFDMERYQKRSTCRRTSARRSGAICRW